MEFKGTKGKWSIKNISEQRAWINITSDKDIIARAFYGELEPIVTLEEATANAQLIASAPEMFEMLKMIHLSFGGGRVITFSDKDIEDIEQLLTKITTI
jgi:hypothetical protein